MLQLHLNIITYKFLSLHSFATHSCSGASAPTSYKFFCPSTAAHYYPQKKGGTSKYRNLIQILLCQLGVHFFLNTMVRYLLLNSIDNVTQVIVQLEGRQKVASMGVSFIIKTTYQSHLVQSIFTSAEIHSNLWMYFPLPPFFSGLVILQRKSGITQFQRNLESFRG